MYCPSRGASISAAWGKNPTENSSAQRQPAPQSATTCPHRTPRPGWLPTGGRSSWRTGTWPLTASTMVSFLLTAGQRDRRSHRTWPEGTAGGGGGNSSSLQAKHSPWVMFNSLPMAKLQTLPLTLGGIPCHHRSRTFLEHHLDREENQFMQLFSVKKRLPSGCLPNHRTGDTQGCRSSALRGLRSGAHRDQISALSTGQYCGRYARGTAREGGQHKPEGLHYPELNPQ